MGMRSSEIKGVVIVHSGYGHTKRVADAVADGAKASVLQIDAEGNLSDDAWAQIDQAHHIILGSPTYMGGPSWQFKKFADASSKPWFADLWKDKVWADATPDEMSSGDLDTARLYGARVAGIAAKLFSTAATH